MLRKGCYEQALHVPLPKTPPLDTDQPPLAHTWFEPTTGVNVPPQVAPEAAPAAAPKLAEPEA